MFTNLNEYKPSQMCFKACPPGEYCVCRNQINNQIYKMNKPVTIYAFKNHPDAVVPEVAYNSTSACFDITCTETTLIPAKSSAVVPNGLNLTIDQDSKYFMQIYLRSSKGFKHELIPHYGVVDPSYTGDLGVKIYNVGDVDVVIEKGERYAQIAVLPIPDYRIQELNKEEFEELKSRQVRGNKGFGSSGK